MSDIILTIGEERSWLQLRAQPLGSEWLVVITNQCPHVGAVVVAEYDPVSGRASASVITPAGHRDDVIARKQAQALAKKLQQRVCVVAGIHIDDATVEELGVLVNNAEELFRQLTSRL